MKQSVLKRKVVYLLIYIFCSKCPSVSFCFVTDIDEMLNAIEIVFSSQLFIMIIIFNIHF